MRTRHDFGVVRPGMAIGLFGGSFDPPHQGHVQFSREALKRFGLDRLIWLVSPGNPLKESALFSHNSRIEACRTLADHPAIRISGIEARLGTRYTEETLARLQILFPAVRFVWLMGADNLTQLHQWNNWQSILNRMPVGVLARPGHRLAARGSVAARVFRSCRLPERQSTRLPRMAPPCWCFCNMPLRDESSTAIREARHDR